MQKFQNPFRGFTTHTASALLALYMARRDAWDRDFIELVSGACWSLLSQQDERLVRALVYPETEDGPATVLSWAYRTVQAAGLPEEWYYTDSSTRYVREYVCERCEASFRQWTAKKPKVPVAEARRRLDAKPHVCRNCRPAKKES